MLSTLQLAPVADNTLVQDPTGHLSNGVGQHLYVGDTAQAQNNIRRATLKFDVAALPAGSTINSATLTLNMSKSPNSTAQSIAVHRALKDWGEGTSNAALGGTGPGGEGDGIQATTGDATWLYTFFNTQSWTAAGGDFTGSASAATAVSGLAKYQWSGAGLVSDVQQWRGDSTTNHGWILTGNESASATVKQFDSKDNATASVRPVLTIDYTVPPDLTVTKTHTGNFKQGDTGDTYTITVTNGGAGPTAGSTVSLVDTLPTGLSATGFSGTGWTVNLSTLTATRSDILAAGAGYPALTLTVAVSATAAASLTNTATVSGGGEVVTNNDTASDVTTILPVTNNGTTIITGPAAPFTNNLGGTAAFTVALAHAPTSNVTINLTTAGANPTEGTLSTSVVTFTPTNYSTGQTVTVTGANNANSIGNKPYSVHLAATSGDTSFNGTSTDVALTNIAGLARVYNIKNTDYNVHFYTASKGEHDILLSLVNTIPQPHNPWVDTETTYTSFSLFRRSTGEANILFVQRLYNPHTSEHYYTLSLGEAQFLASAGWGWETPNSSESDGGFQGYMYAPNNFSDDSTKNPVGPAGTKPVFRMYETVANTVTQTGDHTLTNDPSLYTVLRSQAGWVEHSMVGFAVQIASLATAGTQSVPAIQSAPAVRSAVGLMETAEISAMDGFWKSVGTGLTNRYNPQGRSPRSR